MFSTWRLTLDIVEAGLNQASLCSIRFDGKVPQKERQSVVDRFKKDPNIRVMLLTLSCGAVGQVISSPRFFKILDSVLQLTVFHSLTLTVASRAYLMEPHWLVSWEK